MKPGMIGTAIAAGFVATVVLSAMMLLKRSMGLMPELDPIAMLTSMAGASSPALGWIAHFVIGSIFWGVGFAIVSPYLPDPYPLRGAVFAVGAWLIMMLVVMPMAGAGSFGLGLGIMAPVVTLALHATMERRWNLGLDDPRATLASAPWLAPSPADVAVRTFDVRADKVVKAPNLKPSLSEPAQQKVGTHG